MWVVINDFLFPLLLWSNKVVKHYQRVLLLQKTSGHLMMNEMDFRTNWSRVGTSGPLSVSEENSCCLTHQSAETGLQIKAGCRCSQEVWVKKHLGSEQTSWPKKKKSFDLFLLYNVTSWCHWKVWIVHFLCFSGLMNRKWCKIFKWGGATVESSIYF